MVKLIGGGSVINGAPVKFPSRFADKITFFSLDFEQQKQFHKQKSKVNFESKIQPYGLICCPHVEENECDMIFFL